MNANNLTNEVQNIKVSKFLSLVLRHKPETIGLTLDEQGWADTKALIEKATQHHIPLTLNQLKTVVETNDKRRFSFNDDFSKIRANQGHSLQVNLGLKEEQPPARLFHGTAERNLESIKQQGLIKGQRHHVHLSIDSDTAKRVGMRYGKPAILTIAAQQMYDDGFKFYVSENGIWLTDFVLPKYITFPMSE